MPSSKNNKSNSGTPKRYTTRQIMELTEKRRKQMDEEARLEALARQKAAEVKALEDPKFAQEVVSKPLTQEIGQAAQEQNASLTQKNNDDQTTIQSSGPQQSLLEVPVNKHVTEPAVNSIKQDDDFKSFHEAIAKFTRQVIDHPARFEFPSEVKAENKTEEAPLPLVKKEQPELSQEPTVVDGKSVAAMFREQPQTPTEQAVSELIEHEFDKAVENVISVGTVSPKEAVQESYPIKSIRPGRIEDRPQGGINKTISMAMEWIFMLSSSVLLVFMFVHVVYSGWSRHYYDQSSFVVMMALSALWLNRRFLQKRTHWFWGSSVIIAGGLGVFLAAALEGRVFIELAGFVIVSFGLFLWRYTEESASRLFFPLVCLMFMLAPPGNWEQSATPLLNDMIYGWSAGILNSFHLPALFDEGNFHVGAGTVSALGDPAAFRSIVGFMSLAAVCVSFQNMTGFWSLVLCLSVVFWGVLANIVRVTITGVMLENFGVEYATMFYTEYSLAIVMIVLIAGITLTAGLLPHKEE